MGPKFFTILAGVVLGGVTGFLMSLAILLVTSLPGGPTAWVEDEPLHGWVLAVAIFWGSILAGAVVGGIVAWRRTVRVAQRVENHHPPQIGSPK